MHASEIRLSERGSRLAPRAPFLATSAPRHGLPAPFPARSGVRVTPLVLAAEMYPALERLVLGARSHVHMAFRIFDPMLSLRSAEARERGLERWADLLVEAVGRGVHVRVLLTDFEPTVAHDLHARSWAALREMEGAVRALAPSARDRLEMLIAPHEGEMGWGPRQLFRAPVWLAVRRSLADLAGRDGGFEAAIVDRPGLWRHHRLRDGRPVARWGAAPRLWPATHHHKFAVVDGRAAVVGGLDLDERRWDAPGHRRPAQQTWRDLSALIEGPAVADCEAHFAWLWNRDAARLEAIRAYWLEGVERTLDCRTPSPMPTVDHAPPAPVGAGRVQMLRTCSRRDPSPWAMGPRPAVRELRRAVRGLIVSAQTSLYIETQFLRDMRVARWIALAARRSRRLSVIIVVPQAPDDVAFGGQSANPAHAHGEWLQARALGWLRRALGERLGVYALARDRPLATEEAELDPAAHAAGAGIVYVHSKLLLADDRLAMISSANLNGRSLNWDTEFGFLWEEPDAVADLRRRAWALLFDCDPDETPPLDRAGEAWRARAVRNLARPPAEREGFILPYNDQRVRRAGRRSLFVPDDLV